MNSALKEYGEKGRIDYPQPPSIEDVLRGYMRTREADWALQTLIDWHEQGLASTGLKVGDRVRVRRLYVHRGDIDRLGGRLSGWSGYAPLFSDHVATVREVFWNAVYHYWGARIEYDTNMCWSDWQKDFYVLDESVSFYFAVDQVKKVGVKKEKKRRGCV